MKKLMLFGLLGLSTLTFASPFEIESENSKSVISVHGDHLCWAEECPKEAWVEMVNFSVTDTDGVETIRVIQKDNWLPKTANSEKQVVRTIEFPYTGDEVIQDAVGVPMERGNDWELTIEVIDQQGEVEAKSFLVQANQD